jgi:uncharacterized protein (DUF58 family)
MLAKLHGLQLRARRVVEGYLAGLHRSPYHGFSVEFAEHREYAPGDDLRYVDWKVFGRTNKPYVKQYEDETNLLCCLVLDASESMAYQSRSAALSKFEYCQILAAALAWLVLQQQDAVGLVTFDSDVRAFVRPSSNPAILKQLLHVLETAPSGAKTRTGPIFHELAQRMSKRGVVIILSDLLDDVRAMLAGIKHLRHRRHDVIVLHVLDPAEVDFPFQRMTRFEGLEGLPHVLADGRSVRRAYLSELESYLREVSMGCRAQQVDYHLVRTDQPMDLTLSRFLAARAEKGK